MQQSEKKIYSYRDAWHPAYIHDPYRVYRHLLAAGSVQWDEALQSWLVFPYADVIALLSDPRFVSSRISPNFLCAPAHIRLAIQQAFQSLPLFAHISENQADRSRLHTVLSRSLVPILEGARPAVQSFAYRLLNMVVEQSSLDVIWGFAFSLTAMIMERSLGIPPDECLLLAQWVDRGELLMSGRLSSEEDVQQSVQAMVDLYEYVSRLIVRPHHGSIAQELVTVWTQDGILNERGAVRDIFDIVVTTLFTAMHAVGDCLFVVLQHPEQFQLLQEDSSLIPQAVTECLRYDGPAQEIVGEVINEMELGGQRILTGQHVIACLGAANRDPGRFAHPDQFDIRRKGGRHIAFGSGIHACMGMYLARYELELALQAFARCHAQPSVETAERDGGRLMRCFKTLTVIF